LNVYASIIRSLKILGSCIIGTSGSGFASGVVVGIRLSAITRAGSLSSIEVLIIISLRGERDKADDDCTNKDDSYNDVEPVVKAEVVNSSLVCSKKSRGNKESK